MTTRKASELAITMAHVMLPKDGNPMGFVHGGVVAKYIDEAAAVVASRHARCMVVTASFDNLVFHNHVAIGNLLLLKTSLNLVGTTSMEIGVRVEEEELTTGRVKHIASAYLTFVAIDEQGRPTPVPQALFLEPEEKRRRREASDRRQKRLAVGRRG
ncbi:MAG: acyl-CoA thioesterase [Desulfobulbaceae bacterium]|nr:MAG: acyl-CoA thioesterase [Desulfobulbaceae bacterium]